MHVTDIELNELVALIYGEGLPLDRAFRVKRTKMVAYRAGGSKTAVQWYLSTDELIAELA